MPKREPRRRPTRPIDRPLPGLLLITPILTVVGLACGPEDNPMSPAPRPEPDPVSLHVRCSDGCRGRDAVHVTVDAIPLAPEPPGEDPCRALLRVVPRFPSPDPGPTIEIACQPSDAGHRVGTLPVVVWVPVSGTESTVHVRWALDERISPTLPFQETVLATDPADPGGWGSICLELHVQQDRTLARHILNLEVRDSAPSPDESRVEAARATLHRTVPFAVVDAASPLWLESRGLTRSEGGLVVGR